MAAIHFHAEDFEQALAQPGVWLVDFWATWCMPCKMVAPVIEKVAETYQGRATVGKGDIDEERELAEKYGIQSIPTVMVFRDGQPVDTVVGARPFEAYAEALDKAL